MLSTLGLIVIVVGLIAFAWGVLQKRRADRLIDAPLLSTGALNLMWAPAADAGAANRLRGGPVSVQGAVICDQPLLSPISKRPCLYYRIRRTVEFRSGTGRTGALAARATSRLLDDQCFAAPFAIDDGSGHAFIDARNGGDFEPLQLSESRSTTADGMVYRIEEEILPLMRTLFVSGKISDGGVVTSVGVANAKPFLAIEPPLSGPMIISNRSRSHLLRETSKRAKLALILSFAASVIGCTLATTGASFEEKKIANEQAEVEAAAIATANVQLSAPPEYSNILTPPPVMTAIPSPPTTGVAPDPTPPPASPKKHNRRGPSAHR